MIKIQCNCMHEVLKIQGYYLHEVHNIQGYACIALRGFLETNGIPFFHMLYTLLTD